MLKSIQKYLIGTLKVSVCKSGSERFLNLVNREKFKIWDVRSDGSDCITFEIYRHNFKHLRDIVKKSHVKIHIISKHGLFHSLRNYRRRFGIAAGILIIAAGIYASSFFIWDVRVSGCENVSAQEILTLLSDNGFSVGKAKHRLNIKEIENSFLKNNDKISWISINIKGTTAYVEVREKDDTPELIDSKQPCSIYAARDGVIASVTAYMGYSLVKPGDTVTAGDLVVTGNYTDKYGQEYKLHSYAKVMAYTTHSSTVTVPFETTEHVRTGRVKNKYSFKFLSFNIPLYFSNKIIYNNYDVTKSQKLLKLTDNLALPIGINKTTYTEVDVCKLIKSEQTALEDAYEQLRDFEYDLVGIMVLGRDYEETVNEDSVTVKVILNCYEDIGISKIIE